MKKSLLTASIAVATFTVGATVFSPAANAAVIGNLQNFAGDTAGGRFTFTDAGANTVNLFAEITPPTINGDIRGIFFNLLGGTSGLNVTSLTAGATVADLQFNTCDTGQGNNLNPCPVPNPGFNVAFEVGGPGISGGRIPAATFQITRTGLTAASFLNQTIGVRYQATGTNGNGSSKLVGTAIPTPALLPGLIGMGVAAWRKRKGEVETSADA